MTDIPAIVAHRGASKDAPENTLAAFALAWEQGADAIEGDFHLTGDGHVVCHHDQHLGRIFPGKRAIRESSLAELRSLSGGGIPTLAEFLAIVKVGKRALLELKTGPEIVEPVAREISMTRIDPSCLTMMAFHPETVRAARDRFSTSTVNWLVDLKTMAEAERIALHAIDLGVDGVGLSASPGITATFLQPLFDAGLQVHIWTEDQPTEARRYAELGVASITTNQPRQIRRAFGLFPR